LPIPLCFSFLTDVAVHRGVQVGSTSATSKPRCRLRPARSMRRGWTPRPSPASPPRATLHAHAPAHTAAQCSPTRACSAPLLRVCTRRPCGTVGSRRRGTSTWHRRARGRRTRALRRRSRRAMAWRLFSLCDGARDPCSHACPHAGCCYSPAWPWRLACTPAAAAAAAAAPARVSSLAYSRAFTEMGAGSMEAAAAGPVRSTRWW